MLATATIGRRHLRRLLLTGATVTGLWLCAPQPAQAQEPGEDVTSASEAEAPAPPTPDGSGETEPVIEDAATVPPSTEVDTGGNEATEAAADAATEPAESSPPEETEEEAPPDEEASDEETDPQTTNTASGDGTTVVSAEGDSSVATGGAAGTGSTATNGVTQVAAGEATDQGQVAIDQLVVIVNVGEADATTGENDATGSVVITCTTATVCAPGDESGGGTDRETDESDGGTDGTAASGSAEITTGTADAAGNQSITIVSQIADADAEDGEVVDVQQDADVVNAGAATATTGGNLAVGAVVASSGTAGGTAAAGTAVVTTGDATAVGNQSETDVEQVAGGTANGDAVVTVGQTATVVNTGAATADSGGNVALGTAVSTSAGTGSVDSTGISQVTTGDASATGNVSSTTVSQVAAGSASGTSQVWIVQTTVVANLGTATANTGGNLAVGSTTSTVVSGGPPDADPAVPDLSATELSDAFWAGWQDAIEQLLAQLAEAFGDAIDSVTLTFALHEDSQGADGGPRVLIRQGVVIIDVGLARSNTGDNTATGTHVETVEGAVAASPALEGAQVSSTGSAGWAWIVTGDASAEGNVAATVICQRYGSEEACPELPSEEPPAEEEPEPPVDEEPEAEEPDEVDEAPDTPVETPPVAVDEPEPDDPPAPVDVAPDEVAPAAAPAPVLPAPVAPPAVAAVTSSLAATGVPGGAMVLLGTGSILAGLALLRRRRP